MQKWIICLTTVPAVLAAAESCTYDENMAETSSYITVRLSHKGQGAMFRTVPEYDEEYRINDVTAYRFDEGTLQEILFPVSSEDGLYRFRVSETDGTLYVIANASEAAALADISPGLPEDSFTSMQAALGEMVASGLMMTGHVHMSGGELTVELVRSVARLDIVSSEKDVYVVSVSVKGYADRGTVLHNQAAGHKSTSSSAEFSADWSEAPLENGRRTLLYVPEQTGTVLAEVVIVSGEGRHRLEAVFPQTLKRNTVYTLNVKGTGAAASVSVLEGDWEAGDTSDSAPVYRGLVDVQSSDLSAGVRVSPSRDTVYVSHTAQSFSLAVIAGPGAEVSLTGKVPGVDVSTSNAVKSGLEYIATVNVSSPLRFPGTMPERMYIDVRESGIRTGRIVMVFLENPVRLGGLLSLDENGVCDFGKYIDGEYGTVTLPAGMELYLEFPDGEAEWMKAEAGEPAFDVKTGREEKVYRITGGWKPNDHNADGRIQEGRIVIMSADGGSETYTVRRVNLGLPVVKIGDTWWARYNLRGNAGEFSDQILSAEDPASGYVSQLGMLVSATDDELLGYMGHQYQGGNLQGMPLNHNGDVFYYDGMVAYPGNFGLIDPAVSAPDGYKVPEYSDFAFLVPSDDYNLGGPGTRSYTNREGVGITVNIVEREVSFLGRDYGPVSLYEFESGGNRLVLYGLGHQWNTSAGNIARMNILFATYGDGGRSWSLEGYSQNDRPGQNWLKFSAQNTTKTRTIRCVKIPVEYIYE